MKQISISALAAGVAIGISGIAYLSTNNPWTFPIGLLIICAFGFHLFTGKVPYAKFEDTGILIWMLALNLLAASGVGILTHFVYPALAQKASELAVVKINEGLWVFPRAILCNILIFAAVHMWKKLCSPNNIISLIFATAVFVMCGFEHCIANAFYFGCAFNPELKIINFIILNILGNTIGGLLAYKTVKYINKDLG